MGVEIGCEKKKKKSKIKHEQIHALIQNMIVP